MSHMSPKAFGYPALIELRRRWFPCVRNTPELTIRIRKGVCGLRGGGTILRGSKLSATGKTCIRDLPFPSGKTTLEKVRGRCF
ncbi:hypothetical protein HanIR_Chr07g0331871 [Helianthus annuus]|nr:hypothetical protein HanIR_Chr07g0331871 [Helianthus annuus]